MVKKREIMFVCDSCGFDSAKWSGKCPNCGAWNTVREVRGLGAISKSSSKRSTGEATESRKIGDVDVVSLSRISTGFSEFDRVLGGTQSVNAEESGNDKENKRGKTQGQESGKVAKIQSGKDAEMQSGKDAKLQSFKLEHKNESAGNGGQGIVPGEIMLLSGDPGVGKSTLLLQVALMLSGGAERLSRSEGDVRQQLPNSGSSAPSSLSGSRHITMSKSQTISKSSSNSPSDEQPSAKGRGDGIKVLYVTGEESLSQVRMRAERIVGGADLSRFDLEILATVDTDNVIATIEKMRPGVVIVDSIQTISSESLSGFAGSVPQIRFATSQLVTLGKSLNIPIFLIGHVTKEGIVAGPQLLSHMVDAVLYLEGEATTGTRILRAYKNRFGDTSEVGIFLMEERGLVELFDASTFFMDRRDRAVPGSCLGVVMEGSRPLLVEVQALSVPSSLAFPRRVSNGIDNKRLELILAVLQKHVGLRVDKLDIFVNVVGGLTVKEVAADLAVCLAIISSVKNVPLNFACAIAEVGLLGELKRVPSESVRIREAKRLGCKIVVTPEKKHFLKEIVDQFLSS